MSHGDDDRIGRLMAEGLDHYGMDRISQAAKCWRAVLELDPNHAEARDYLSSAGLVEDELEPGPGPASEGLLSDAVDLVRRGEAQEAVELLSSLVESGASIEAHAYLELLRSRLYGELLGRMGDGLGVPSVRMAPRELMKFNLPANAGFLLSRVDGATSVNDIIAVSGMDPFEVVRTLARLADAGIVEVQL